MKNIKKGHAWGNSISKRVHGTVYQRKKSGKNAFKIFEVLLPFAINVSHLELGEFGEDSAKAGDANPTHSQERNRGTTSRRALLLPIRNISRSIG